LARAGVVKVVRIKRETPQGIWFPNNYTITSFGLKRLIRTYRKWKYCNNYAIYTFNG
jgi:hypothetical protein